MTKIMLVDNHSLMRRAVRDVIEQEDDMSLVAEAYSGSEAEALAQETQPDVILLDPDMPEENGLELMERIRTFSPNTCFVIFTTFRQDQHVLQALQSGALGYLTKDAEPEDLLHVLRCVAHRHLCLPGPLASGVMAYLRAIQQAREAMPWSPVLAEKECDEANSFSFSHALCWPPEAMNSLLTKKPHRARRAKAAQAVDAPPRPPRPLTDRERQIWDQMRKGRKNSEIARDLNIAESTVHKHVQNIFEKLHARNRTEAIYLTNSAV
jgi:two-component system, NarL family, nitrate/nitrite response regulator NarL